MRAARACAPALGVAVRAGVGVSVAVGAGVLVSKDVVLYASDYWHGDAKYFGTVKAIADKPGLSAQVKQKILGENSKRLLG